MKFTGRVSGIVAYSDDSHQQFAAHLDERGIVSVNSGDESAQAILELQNSNNWLEDLLALVTGSTNPISLSPTGSASKTVNSAALHFSGRVSRDNDTWEDFAVQYDVKAGGEFTLNSSGSGGGEVSAYDEFLTATITSWFEALVGSGNVTL